MKNPSENSPVLFFFALLLFSSILAPVIARAHIADHPPKQSTYIVHVLPPENMVFSGHDDLRFWHESFLPLTNTSDSGAHSWLLYSYSDAYSGFAARLTEDELKAIESKPGFVHATEDKLYQLQTTHTPDYLGLHLDSGIWKRSNLGKGIIVGLLDSGIHPTHVSFRDDGVPPPPSKWKGSCDFDKDVCNNKLIGARTFLSGFLHHSGSADVYDATDSQGHGTHTASTAAGNFVDDADFLGLANGTAAGVAPHAHLAMYKVCTSACFSSDILAGMEAAIKDGVDVISLSLGGPQQPYMSDPIAIGSFRSVAKGIFVSAAAGNSGPNYFTLSNSAPWLLTVAASTIDRKFRVTVRLGDGQELDGESLYQPRGFTSKSFPLAYYPATETTSKCLDLTGVKVTKKIVVCDGGGSPRLDKGNVVLSNNGSGLLLINQETQGSTTLADPQPLPASLLAYEDGVKIKSYVKSTPKPTAKLFFKGTVLKNVTAPEVAYFSSRGPNTESLGISKPDISGPGVNVLAAWPFPVSSDPKPSNQNFNVISGTSMSTPHLSGVAALVKSVHPDWSPAAIKSAIMTTAYDKGSNGKPIQNEKHHNANIFQKGSGHVDPSKAVNPGLVYDIDTDDYIGYLCGLGYKDEEVTAIVGKAISCKKAKSIGETELNYPNIIIPVKSSLIGTVKRTVTNVGKPTSTYKVEVDTADGIPVIVNPTRLVFSKLNEKKTFSVTGNLTGSHIAESYQQLKWVSEDHVVKSFVVLYKNDVN